MGVAALPSVAGAEFDADDEIEIYWDRDPYDDAYDDVYGDHYLIGSVDGVTAESVAIHGAHAENGPAPIAHDDWD